MKTSLNLLAALLCVGPVSVAASEVVTYVYTNVQGTVLATADAQGSVLSRSAFSAYGFRTAGIVAPGPAFVGGREDGTGLDYIDGRFYDPALGMYLSLPSGEAQVEAKYVGYGFAFGNPYAYGRPKSSP